MWAVWGDFFSSSDDPIINNHVNVITGRLQLSFQDHVVQGASPLPLRRTYTNHGQTKTSHSRWNFTEGWCFFSHTHLYLREMGDLIDLNSRNRFVAEIVEMNGGKIVFYERNRTRKRVYMTPYGYDNQDSDVKSYRDDPKNHRLEFIRRKGRIEVFLANGGTRHYVLKKKSIGMIGRIRNLFQEVDVEYLLEEERSPSGILTRYIYHEDDTTLTVIQSSINERKEFSRITLHQTNDYPRFIINANTSDGKEFTYHGMAIDRRCHLASVNCSFRPEQNNEYAVIKEKKGGWLTEITASGRKGLKVNYYFSKDKNIHEGNGVESIYEGDVKLASFRYFHGVTEVRDQNNILTKYHYSNNTLHLIEYFDEGDQLYRSERYTWKDCSLVLKENLNSDGEVICGKQYSYDMFKNLTCETISKGEERFSKLYTYNKKHLLVKESQSNGLLTIFEYLDETDLISSKKTFSGDLLLFEEYFKYDSDFLLIEKSCFDGFRQTIERSVRDQRTGMITEVENGLTKIYYTYNGAKQIVKEETEFSTVTTEYDGAGRVIKKTFPNGGVNEYLFDEWGNAIEIKEMGSGKRLIEYDHHNRPISCTMNGKVSRNTYNNKGLVHTETDHNGSVTTFTYDAFGRCIQKENPLGGVEKFEYDILGNVVLHTAPNGGVTKTTYNLFNKPKTIVYPNGRTLTNVYNQDGTLKEVHENNRLKTSFVYDGLQRMIKRVSGSLEEEWEYEGAVLKKYTDVRGLITVYDYDGHGRKIKESSEDRVKEFFYDKMGFVKEVREGDLSSTYLYDSEQRLLESSENGSNHVINEYDVEGRKISSRKMTSEGEALDQFFYDDEGSIIRHIDPLGQETLFIYDHLKRTEVDPLGNKMVTTFDPLYQEIQKQKLSADDTVLFSERFFYDAAGNVIKRITDEFGMEVEYAYDIMGNLVEEIESGVKRTSYAYDSKERLISKTLPNGVSLHYQYDDLDRKIEEKSSDTTVWYLYKYSSTDLVEIKDRLLGGSIKRDYNRFGELISEINFSGFKTSWYYNTFGKVERIILPDDSSIHYSYVGGHMSAIARYDKDDNLCYQHVYTKFDPNHHVEEEELPFNLGTIHSKRDLLERCTKMQSPYHNIEHTYNPTSLVTKKINSLTGDKEYSYDDLSQITSEGKIRYDFDALGNPKNCEVNQLNQLIKTPAEELSYDGNGNLKNTSKMEYSYDAWNRLKRIAYTNGKRVVYTYDPFSRLAVKKTWKNNDLVSVKHFLYDRDYEIGSINSDGIIGELKVLGLGIKGDIGAAVGIELKGKVYIPLHDLQGNIISLVTSKGKISETYTFSVFGEERKKNYDNPWRFASKRADEHLIFFGLRFYDPALKRWISPDPLGFVDSRNPYLYVLNNPLNRLDEFGLQIDGMLSKPPSIEKFPYPGDPQPKDYTSTWLYNSQMNLYHGEANIDGQRLRLCIALPDSMSLDITDQEKQQKQFDLSSRIAELIKGAENLISIVTAQNGINNTMNDWLELAKTLQAEHPPGTLIIGLFNETQSVPVDVGRTMFEKGGYKTKSVRALDALFTNLIDIIKKSAPKTKISHNCHSEAGAIYYSMYQNATKELKDDITQYINCVAFGPAECIPKAFGYKVLNIYSDKDFVTGRYAKPNDPLYDVKIVSAITPWWQRMGYLADHGILKPTYTTARKKYIEDIKENEGGYYVPGSR